MTAKGFALLVGVLFLAAGLMGFVNNPIIGDSPDVIFHADTLHSSIHIASGVLFILFALITPAGTVPFMIVFGIVYLLLGILGLIDIGTGGMGKVLGFLHVNGPDNLLHIGLGLLILVGAISVKRTAIN